MNFLYKYFFMSALFLSHFAAHAGDGTEDRSSVYLEREGERNLFKKILEMKEPADRFFDSRYTKANFTDDTGEVYEYYSGSYPLFSKKQLLDAIWQLERLGLSHAREIGPEILVSISSDNEIHFLTVPQMFALSCIAILRCTNSKYDHNSNEHEMISPSTDETKDEKVNYFLDVGTHYAPSFKLVIPKRQ